MNKHIEYWKEQIRRDLSPFCDPGTELDIIDDNRSIIAEWKSRNQLKNATFTISPDGPVQVSWQDKTMSYRSFFASSEMADLSGIAKMMLQATPPRLYIPTKARLLDVQGFVPKSAVELIGAEISKDNTGLSQIIIVVGDAGAGKTMVLKELVRTQALSYNLNKLSKLFLYINAQGRALARFNEALATELQDLRATLTYHAVATLVRLGLIVPVIDGFDELFGISGYEEAFSSLSQFIGELDGEGQIIASARSTYYEEEFLSRSTKATSLGGQSWTQIPVKICEWTDEEFNDYITQRTSQERMSEKKAKNHIDSLEAIFGQENAYLKKKPLFVSKVLDLVFNDDKVHGGPDLIENIVEIFLERERREKLLGVQGQVIITNNQLRILLATIAEEMWNQGTRELDRESVRWIAEYVLGNGNIDEASQKIIMKRMPNMAFLVHGSSYASTTFEHEFFFTYFLGNAFARELANKGSGLRILLGRSMLPSSLGSATIRELKKVKVIDSEEQVLEIISRIVQASDIDFNRASIVRENAGSFLADIFKYLSEKIKQENAFEVRNVVFPGVDLSSIVLKSVKFNNVEFKKVDLRGTKFLKSFSENVVLQDVLIDINTTRIEIGELDKDFSVYGLRLYEKGGIRNVYDPSKISMIMKACGVQISDTLEKRNIDNDYMSLIEKLLRAYRRANPICTDDDTMRGVFRNKKWTKLESILIDNEIIKKENRDASGKSKEFLRRNILPEKLMAGLNKNANVAANIREFWADLEKTSRKLLSREKS